MLAARLIIGGIFVYSGYEKATAMAMTAGFFAKMGIPAFLAYIVTYGEMLGGLAVILGVYTELAAGLLCVIMLGAIYFTYALGFQVFGLPTAVLAGLLSIVANGAGAFVLPLKRNVPTYQTP